MTLQGRKKKQVWLAICVVFALIASRHERQRKSIKITVGAAAVFARSYVVVRVRVHVSEWVRDLVYDREACSLMCVCALVCDYAKEENASK